MTPMLVLGFISVPKELQDPHPGVWALPVQEEDSLDLLCQNPPSAAELLELLGLHRGSSFLYSPLRAFIKKMCF